MHLPNGEWESWWGVSYVRLLWHSHRTTDRQLCLQSTAWFECFLWLRQQFDMVSRHRELELVYIILWMLTIPSPPSVLIPPSGHAHPPVIVTMTKFILLSRLLEIVYAYRVYLPPLFLSSFHLTLDRTFILHCCSTMYLCGNHQEVTTSNHLITTATLCILPSNSHYLGSCIKLLLLSQNSVRVQVC